MLTNSFYTEGLLLTVLSMTGIATFQSFAAAALPQGNLIINGNSEVGSSSKTAYDVVSTPGWTETSNFNVVRYNTRSSAGDFPSSTDPGPSDRGKNFFAGGPSNSNSSATQLIDVSAYAGDIDSGNVRFNLAGYLGGFAEQGDNAILRATLTNGRCNTIETKSIGPVTAGTRNRQTGLLLRSISGILPIGTRQIRLLLQMTRTAGSYNDGYADNLSLTLTAPSSNAAPNPLRVPENFGH